jgi:hypothetical protein
LSNENNLLKARNAELENARAAQDVVICDLEKRLGQFADENARLTGTITQLTHQNN